ARRIGRCAGGLRAAAQTALSQPAGDADSAILLDEQVTTVADSGEIKTLYRRAFRILRPEGRKRKMLAVHFDGETRLTYLKGWSLLSAEKNTRSRKRKPSKPALSILPFTRTPATRYSRYLARNRAM